jgi:hypothetical protein
VRYARTRRGCKTVRCKQKKKMKPTIILLNLFLLITITIHGQSRYQKECTDLVKITFNQELIEVSKIENQITKLNSAIKYSSENNLNECNCADSVWIAKINDKRNFHPCRHCSFDTTGYLRNLISIVDSLILDKEFSTNILNTKRDSFNYVVKRFYLKKERREKDKNEFMNFYHCIDPEVIFLKKQSKFLYPVYLDFFDDKNKDYDLRDILLSSTFTFDNKLEEEILNRIISIEDKRFYYRMIGILSGIGGQKSIEYFCNQLSNSTYDEKDLNLLINSSYMIIRRTKENTFRQKFENILRNRKMEDYIRKD